MPSFACGVKALFQLALPIIASNISRGSFELWSPVGLRSHAIRVCRRSVTLGSRLRLRSLGDCVPTLSWFVALLVTLGSRLRLWSPGGLRFHAILVSRLAVDFRLMPAALEPKGLRSHAILVSRLAVDFRLMPAALEPKGLHLRRYRSALRRNDK